MTECELDENDINMMVKKKKKERKRKYITEEKEKYIPRTRKS